MSKTINDFKEKEIRELENKILYHKKKYYDGEPEISDAAYDAMEDKLRELDPNNPVLFIIGTPEGGKINHDYPMLSCQKATSIDDIIKWSQGLDLLVGYKIDGFSLSLIYQNGKLIQAATRGNGIKGDDSTIITMKIPSIPKVIPELNRINIRGELFMQISEFNNINKKEGGNYSSPRNLAVGTIKQKDLNLFDKRPLEFRAFELLGYKDQESLKIKVDTLQKWNFQSADFKLLNSPSKEDIISIYKEVEGKRTSLDFEIDGLIFKYNNVEARQIAGYTSHHPKWMMALKFTSKGRVAKLRGIKWQVGRMGILTPVAELDPVELMGATIRRATLHNAEFVESLNIAIDDNIFVIRSGDVIPKITEVISKGLKNAQLPIKCPSCGSILNREGVNLICTGEVCREREIHKIRYFVKIIDLFGLGPKNISRLYDKGLVKDFTDLYDSKLTEYKLISLLGKNGSKIYESIQNNKEIPFEKFLASLGIENLGIEMAKLLTKHFQNYEELKNALIEQLIKIEGISDIIASNIKKGVNDPSLGDKLLSKGVEILYGKRKPKKFIRKKGTLAEFFDISDVQEIAGENEFNTKNKEIKSVYVTGKVEGMTKNEIKTFLERHNFEWASLNRSLDLLVTGINPGKSKLEKAKKYGIEIKTWKEFLQEISRS